MPPEIRQLETITKVLLEIWAVWGHMTGADVMQLDHCFPFRLQSLDFDTDSAKLSHFADSIDTKGKTRWLMAP
jgi:hypothetical protein